jgi:hypothetical protein
MRTLLILTIGALLPGALHAQQSPARIWNERLLAAIRLNVPNPPGHARNLHHTAVAMYDAWAAYDPTAVGYIYNEKAATMPADVAAARREAISYAAYRILRNRFATGPGSAVTLANLDTQLVALGYDTTVAQAATTLANNPAELGKRIGQAILNWGAADGFALTSYPQTYNGAVNPNMSAPLSVLGTNANFETNMALGFGIPAGTNPNFWQPLDLATSVTQNGIPIPGGAQSFVGVQALATTPFSLTRTDALKPWIDNYGGPSRLSTPGNPSPTDAAYKDNAMDVLRKSALLNDNTLLDYSPKTYGNNPLGSDAGTGFPRNPLTSQPWAGNPVKRSDFVRVLAEFWADGPNSETPPGHWHVVANEVSEMGLLQKRIRGTGPFLDDLEWDVKVYFALSGATHDAACAAWALKRYYSGARPITMIRYMGSKGQSTNSAGPSYHPEGLPLETGVVEVITSETTVPGGKHEQIWDVKYNTYFPGSFYIGEIAVYSWPGEHPSNLPAPSIATNQSLVRWQLAKDWLPFQRKTFNTPAFPGFVSGHSTFSRAAAEVLTIITGSHLFPGGFHHHVVPANSMQIDLGPSTDVDLQWCSYYDAADQAGQSRRWGGIHPYEDDYIGRQIGAVAGKSAYALAEKYWTGAIANESMQPAVTMTGGGAVLTWQATRGMYHKVQMTTDFTGWADATAFTQAYDTNGTWTDPAPLPGRKFYRIMRTPMAPPAP